MQLHVDCGDMQQKGRVVTIRGGGELLLQSVSLVVVGIQVHEWAVLRLPSLHEMSAATERRYAAFQPGLTRYQLLYIARSGVSTHSCAPARCRWQPVTPALLQSPSPSARWWKAIAS